MGKVNAAEAHAMYEAGVRPSAIAARFGVSRPAVSKWVKKWRMAAVRLQDATEARPRVAVPGVPDAPLARLRALRPDLAAIIETHAVLDERDTALLIRARSPWQSQEAVKALVPHKALLASVWAKPVGVCWP